MMGHYYDFGIGHFFGFGWIFMVAFWVLVIWAIIVLVRNVSGGTNRENKEDKNIEDSALRILKERYAKGEINKEEYDEKKKDLS